MWIKGEGRGDRGKFSGGSQVRGLHKKGEILSFLHFLGDILISETLGNGCFNQRFNNIWNEMLGCIYAHLVPVVGMHDSDNSFHISSLYRKFLASTISDDFMNSNRKLHNICSPFKSMNTPSKRFNDHFPKNIDQCLEYLSLHYLWIYM